MTQPQSTTPDGELVTRLLSKPAWVFDMDGTLTEDVHDYEAIRSELGLEPHKPILEQLTCYEGQQRADLDNRLNEIELNIARASVPSEGVHELLSDLSKHTRLGILTRNSRRNARVTLEAIGLSDYFRDEDIIGRDEGPPKPAPDGLNRMLSRWGFEAASAVMIGDSHFDLMTGQAAGASAVYYDPSASFEHAHMADLCITSLRALLV
ncbi:MAG: HAD superfamily hydrolase (TIGR01509 family) [Planctomycetota bacterium]|jgi:HAD superfamily hydrolase (TIGR01509 family)